MAYCNGNCRNRGGCTSCGASAHGGYGALNSLCRSGGNHYPFYTGPCPEAPCGGSCSGNCGKADSRCARCGATLTESGRCACCGWTRPECGERCGRTGGDIPRESDEYVRDGWECTARRDRAQYAVFTQEGPLSLSPGCTAGLNVRGSNSDLFAVDRGCITIREAGFYYAALTVDIPKHVQVDTTLQLELNNRALLPPQLSVMTNGDSTTGNFAGHTVFAAEAGSSLKLDSREYMSIPCPTGQPVFTLTLIRL